MTTAEPYVTVLLLVSVFPFAVESAAVPLDSSSFQYPTRLFVGSVGVESG